MFIRECGSIDKPAIVFLHGNGTHSGMWQAHFEALGQQYHCLAPDFPGYGQSSGQAWRSLEATAEAVMGIIRTQTKQARAHIVGLSLGSSVGLVLLSKAPHLVNHAIIDGAGVLPLPGLPVLKLGLHLLQPWLHQTFVIKALAHAMHVPAAGYAEFRAGMQAMSPAAFTRSFVQALSLRQPPGLARVHCRVLLVAGEKEPEAVNQSNRMLSKVMPNAQCRMLPGMGHGWVVGQPRLHVEMVRAWLSNEPLPRALVRYMPNHRVHTQFGEMGKVQ